MSIAPRIKSTYYSMSPDLCLLEQEQKGKLSSTPVGWAMEGRELNLVPKDQYIHLIAISPPMQEAFEDLNVLYINAPTWQILFKPTS